MVSLMVRIRERSQGSSRVGVYTRAKCLSALVGWPPSLSSFNVEETLSGNSSRIGKLTSIKRTNRKFRRPRGPSLRWPELWGLGNFPLLP